MRMWLFFYSMLLFNLWLWTSGHNSQAVLFNVTVNSLSFIVKFIALWLKAGKISDY